MEVKDDDVFEPPPRWLELQMIGTYVLAGVTFIGVRAVYPDSLTGPKWILFGSLLAIGSIGTLLVARRLRTFRRLYARAQTEALPSETLRSVEWVRSEDGTEAVAALSDSSLAFVPSAAGSPVEVIPLAELRIGEEDKKGRLEVDSVQQGVTFKTHGPDRKNKERVTLTDRLAGFAQAQTERSSGIGTSLG